jgi:hypothetical protein
MKLKRKASLVAAAPSAAAIPKSARFSSEIISTAGRPAERASTPLRPFEADLADHPASAKHWADPAMSLFAQLEELYPADPGQLSGCSLYINEGGRYTCLSAEIAYAPQKDGSVLNHRLGDLGAEESKWLFEAMRGNTPLTCDGASFVLPLSEQYPPRATPGAFTGATLAYFGGHDPEMRLCVGSHCLGVLRLPVLMFFRECASVRLKLDVR